MQRRAAQLGRQAGRHVVHLAVGQQDHACQPFGRGSMLEVALISAHATHLTSRSDLAFALSAVTEAPARAWRLTDYGLSVGARVLAVSAVAAALGVQAPIAAALVIVPALAVTALASLTPAGIGMTSGTVALVLHARGASATAARAAGITLNAVETAAGLTLGIASGFLLAFPSPAARRWTLMSASACACLAVVLGVGGFAHLA